MKTIYLLFAAIFILLLPVPSFAQQHPDSQQKNINASNNVSNAPPTDADTLSKNADTPEVIKGSAPDQQQAATTSSHSLLSSFEFSLSLAILFFGLIIIVLEVFLCYKKVIRSNNILKIIILTLIIICSVLLVTAGYSNQQITGVSGILGSISGYLIGKMDFSKPEDADHQPQNTTPHA